MAKSVCPLCQRRRARRACPASKQQICAVCCGTKRMTEIDCPSDCAYLQAASAHPPAVVQRQQERDLRFLLPILQDLTARQQEILFMLQTFLRTDHPTTPPPTDEDIQQAAAALARTYETASRGIIYEHAADSPDRQRLAAEIRGVIEAKQAEGMRLSDRDLAVALRRLEAAARDAEGSLGDTAEDRDRGRAYRALLRRLWKEPPAAATPGVGGDLRTASGLIVPGH